MSRLTTFVFQNHPPYPDWLTRYVKMGGHDPENIIEATWTEGLDGPDCVNVLIQRKSKVDKFHIDIRL